MLTPRGVPTAVSVTAAAFVGQLRGHGGRRWRARTAPCSTAFVSRLAPAVLADVVLASLENADVRTLGGRFAEDVAAGMGAGA